MCIFLFFCSYDFYGVLYKSSVNLLILLTSCIIPLKVVADGGVSSISNIKELLSTAQGFLKP
jgi:hypothetical protein